MQILIKNKPGIYKFLFLWVLAVTVILSACSSQPGKPGVSTGRLQYSIIDYGAVGDGETLNTRSIQSAIDECSKAGGGMVVIPPGKFLSGTLILKNRVDLHITRGATLLGSIHQSDYPDQPRPEYRALRDSEGFSVHRS